MQGQALLLALGRQKVAEVKALVRQKLAQLLVLGQVQGKLGSAGVGWEPGFAH
jgi:hypothetical protein